MGDNAAEDTDMIEVPVSVEMEATLITGMIIPSPELAAVKDNETFIIIEGVDKRTHIEVDEDSGMEMTRITMTETIGIKIPMVKVILTRVEDGIIITEVKDTVIMEEGEDGIPISNITIQGINRNPNTQIKSLLSTTDGTSIQIPNPIWPIFIPPATTTISITNANSISTSYKYLSVVS